VLALQGALPEPDVHPLSELAADLREMSHLGEAALLVKRDAPRIGERDAADDRMKPSLAQLFDQRQVERIADARALQTVPHVYRALDGAVVGRARPPQSCIGI